MPRYFFDVKDGHRLFDSSGFVCEDDTDAIIRATVLAIGVSLDTPELILSAASLSSTMQGMRLATCPYIPGLHTKIRPNRIAPLRRRRNLDGRGGIARLMVGSA